MIDNQIEVLIKKEMKLKKLIDAVVNRLEFQEIVLQSSKLKSMTRLVNNEISGSLLIFSIIERDGKKRAILHAYSRESIQVESELEVDDYCYSKHNINLWTNREGKGHKANTVDIAEMLVILVENAAKVLQSSLDRIEKLLASDSFVSLESD